MTVLNKKFIKTAETVVMLTRLMPKVKLKNASGFLVSKQ